MARAVAGALLLLCLFFDLVAISAADTTCSAAGAKAERDSPVCGTALLSQARDEIFAKRQRAVGEKVATISADGDTVIGKPDDEAFEKIGKDGTITVAEGKTMEHELEVVDERGRISPYSITDSKDSGAEPPEEAAPESVGSEVVGLAESAESSRSASVFQDHWITLADKGLGGATGAKKILQSVDAYQATWGAAVVWQVDLGDTYLLARIRIAWRLCKCYKPGSMTMEASTDGVSWHSFLQPSGLYVWGGRKIRDYRIVAEARYVRIYATKASPVKWVAMWDVGFYGKMSDKRSNVYGWYHSYVAGVGGLSGTELIHLEAHDGKLFGGTGYWMHSGAFRAAEVVRLDCSFCQWKIDGRPQAYAGRIESLKSVRWTTDGSGSPLQGGPVDRLYAGYYLNWQGAGRVFLASRVDSTRTWVEGIAWARGPFKKNYFSARAVLLHQDKVTKVDHLFLSVGMDGILRGTFGSNVHWASQTETGPVPTRPLALIVCDGSVYFSSSSFIMRRNDGPSPTWSKVFDMANFDSQTVDEAVGGIRGLSSIGSSMLFAWAPNAQSAGCMVRLDPDGDGFTHHQESCVKELASNYLGKNKDGLPAMVVFVIANYNGVLAIPGSGGEGAKHIIGYQILLYGRSTNEFPVDPAQVSRTPSGKRMAYYAGAGFLIRHSAANYEVRQPGGPRYDPMFVFPKHTAVRCYANSPFGDGSVFMGGYDCNHFPSADTAWVMRGESSAIFGKPVPCQKELGCGHVPGEPFKSRGCDLCSGRHFLGPETAFFQRGKPTTCQAVMDHLNNNAPDNVCQEKKSTQVARKCCDGCDFCLGKNFVGSNIAKRRPDGSTLVCASALDYVRQGHATCYQGTAWWKTACCKS